MVGPERLELSHIAALDPKSSASTNFATGPWLFIYYSVIIFFTRAVSQAVAFISSLCSGYEQWQSATGPFRMKNLSQPRSIVKLFRKFFITISLLLYPISFL